MTITDEQIRELRRLLERQRITSQSATDRMSCHTALYGEPHNKQPARTRCAEILNARRAA